MSRFAWFVVFCCLVIFGAAYLVADRILEQVPHIEDEVAYLFQAQVFSIGHLYVDAPVPSNCFFAPFVIDHEGRRFGKYPPGWPLLLAAGVWMGQAWWVNAGCAALTTALLFRLGAELHSPLVGAMAAGLMVTSPFVLILSGSLMAHPSCLLFVTAFLWCFWRVYGPERCRGNSDGWALAMGVALGCAFVIRPYTALAVGFPAVTLVVAALASAILRAAGTAPIVSGILRPVRRATEYGLRRQLRRSWYVVLGFVPLALLVPLTNAVWTGDPLQSPYVLFWPYDRIGFGPGHGTLPGGNTVWVGLSEAVVNVGHLANHLHGWPALSLTFVILLFVVRPRRGRDLYLLSTALALILAYVFYWTSGDVFGPRYVYEATSALIALSAAGILRVWMRVQRCAPGSGMASPGPAHVQPAVQGGKGRALGWGLPIAISLVALFLVDLGLYLPWQLQSYRGLYGITAEPRQVLEQADLNNALVIVRDENGWKDHAVTFAMNRPTLDGDVVYANDCGSLNGRLLAAYPGREVYTFDGYRVRPFSWSE